MVRNGIIGEVKELTEEGEGTMLSTPQKYLRVVVYSTLGTDCILALIAALGLPDIWDASEAEIAALYLALLAGTNSAFNSKPIFGCRMLGAIAAFTAHGLLPAAMIHVVLAEIEPGQSAHLATLQSLGIVTASTGVLLVAPVCWIPVKIWQACEEKQRQRRIKAASSWVPRLN